MGTSLTDESRQDLETWVSSIERPNAPCAIHFDANTMTLVVDVKNKSRDLRLGTVPFLEDVPIDVGLRIVNIHPAGAYKMAWKGRFRSIDLEIPPLTGTVKAEWKGEVGEVNVLGDGGEGIFDLRNPEPMPNVVHVTNASVQVRSSIKLLRVSDGTAILSEPVDAAVIAGDVKITGSHIKSMRCKEPASLHTTRLSVDSLSTEEPLELAEGELDLLEETKDVEVDIRNGAILRIAQNARVSGAKFGGGGTIIVDGLLADSTFGPDCNLQTAGDGLALGVSGSPESVTARALSHIIGAETGEPFAPRSIEEAEGALLEMLDVRNLWIWDVDQLSNAERLSVRFADRQKDRIKEAKEVVPPKGLEGGDPKANRAHFWRRLSDVLSEKKASGEVQSRARFLANEMRSESPISKREKILLWLYRRIGYGEHIGTPLYWFAGASAILVGLLTLPCINPWFCVELYSNAESAGGTPLGFWETAFAIPASPLAFFRFVSAPYVTAIVPRVALITVQVFGILMLFFSLAAIRRVAKAE